MATSGKESLLNDAGRELRHAREAAGLSLRAVRERSRDKFKPSAVGGYERGERAITLDRFCELCAIYGVRPDDLLSRALSPPPLEIVLDPERVGDEAKSGATTES